MVGFFYVILHYKNSKMAKTQKPNSRNIVTIGRLKEIIAKNQSDKNDIIQSRKAVGTDMSNADANDIKDQVRLSEIEDQNKRYGALISKANRDASLNANSKKTSKITGKKLDSKNDTTVIPKPYKVTTKEIDNSRMGLGLAGKVADSTKKKISYNLTSVITSLVKRNMEREKEGKGLISRNSIMGNTVGGFSSKGKSFNKK